MTERPASAPIYFDPADVVVFWVAGVKSARVAWERPAAWDAKGALRLSLTAPIQAWQVAREEFRRREHDEWFKRVYPAYYQEREASKAFHKAGGSVSGWVAHKGAKQ